MKQKTYTWAAVALSGTLLFLTGCDPTLQATVENGVITSSTTFLTAVLAAITQVYTTPAPP